MRSEHHRCIQAPPRHARSSTVEVSLLAAALPEPATLCLPGQMTPSLDASAEVEIEPVLAPQASLCISVLGVYGGERSADADEGSSRFLFIYGYTTVFGNLEQESFV